MNMTKAGSWKEIVKVQMTGLSLTNADLESVRRIRRIAGMLAELTREYEAKPSPQDLESIRQWATELADLSAKLRTTSPPDQDRGGYGSGESGSTTK